MYALVQWFLQADDLRRIGILAATMMSAVAGNVLYDAFATLSKSRRSRFRLEQILRMRDVSIKTSLIARLPEDRRLELERVIQDAFREGDQIWTEHLATVLGPEEATKVLTNNLQGYPQEAKP